MTHSQLKTMLSNRDIQLFDVRNPDEYQAGRISDAVNIPRKFNTWAQTWEKGGFLWLFPLILFLSCVQISVGVLEESLKLSPERFQQKFEVRVPGKDDDNIVFYCRSGNRSAKALFIAGQLGFSR